MNVVARTEHGDIFIPAVIYGTEEDIDSVHDQRRYGPKVYILEDPPWYERWIRQLEEDRK